ncbi:MAG: hypothetical protein WAV27_26700 [Xanthobacteraceae bacterium]
MTLSKLDLVLVAIAAAGLVWIEHNHRVVIGPLAAAEAQAPAASVCPKTDDAPYSAECIKFIGGSMAPALLSGDAARTEPRCPTGDDGAPDGDSCIRNPSFGYARPDRY